MKPLKLAKAMALSFALGAILSVGSDSKLTHQAETIALSQAQAIGDRHKRDAIAGKNAGALAG
jgi:hypothetical protein